MSKRGLPGRAGTQAIPSNDTNHLFDSIDLLVLLAPVIR